MLGRDLIAGVEWVEHYIVLHYRGCTLCGAPNAECHPVPDLPHPTHSLSLLTKHALQVVASQCLTVGGKVL